MGGRGCAGEDCAGFVVNEAARGASYPSGAKGALTGGPNCVSSWTGFFLGVPGVELGGVAASMAGVVYRPGSPARGFPGRNRTICSVVLLDPGLSARGERRVVGWVGVPDPLWGSPVSLVDADKVSHRRHWSAFTLVLR